MEKTPNSRSAAAFVLARWLASGGFPSSLLPAGRDRAFVQDLVYTAVRRLRALRFALSPLLRKRPDGQAEALLLVGAAQILYMDDVPDFAAVSETVDAARSRCGASAARFANAVLRNLLRRREETEKALAAAPLAVRESFPDALVRRWTARYGEDGAAALCRIHNEPARTFLARRDGSFVALERGRRVEDVAGYAEGDFIVQDPGTALAVRLLDPRPGERILDACAAPGGKTVQIAWRGADATACEVDDVRRRRLEENLRRVRLDVHVVSAIPSPEDGLFKKVLVDAPCSNTGVLRRRPDARWNWSERRLAAAVATQREILEKTAPLVEPGGTLVYATCSNEPEENGQQARRFLADHPEFEPAAEEENVPHLSGTDGAYAAALRRKEK